MKKIASMKNELLALNSAGVLSQSKIKFDILSISHTSWAAYFLRRWRRSMKAVENKINTYLSSYLSVIL